MASLRELAAKRTEMFQIDPRIIEVDPAYNVRNDSPELRQADSELRELIRNNGFQADKPVVLRIEGDRAILVAGHRRLKAVMALIGEGIEFETIAAVAEPKGRTEDERDADLLNSNSGHPLSMLDKATVIKRRMGRGVSIDTIAHSHGITTKQVRNLLDLAAAPEAVKEMISEGVVSATQAIKTLQAEGGARATETLTQAVADAQAQGKSKVTAGTMAKAASSTKPAKVKPSMSFLDTIVSDMGVPVEPAPEPVAAATSQERNGFVRPRMTSERFHDMWETLAEITVVDDVKLIHTMVKDCLKS